MRQRANNASLKLLILYVDYIERVTGMTTNKLVDMSQERDSSDRMATKQFNQLNITWILFDRQLVFLRKCINFLMCINSLTH